MGSQGRTYPLCLWPPSPGPGNAVWFPPPHSQQQSWTASNSIILVKQNIQLLLTLSTKYYPSPLLCLKPERGMAGSCSARASLAQAVSPFKPSPTGCPGQAGMEAAS